ncbi:MAG: hypothetical protein E7516_00885 [Ruminococcaceae bacterium]|nr:hypothetical protein [Oscillospiraceae bacterium]
MKKIIAVISAMLIVLTLAACNGTKNGEVTTTLPETTAEEVTTAAVTEESTTQSEITEALTTEATTEEITTTTTTQPTTTKPTTTKKATTTAKPTTTEKKVTAPSSKTDIVKLYNDAAAKAASSKPGYKKSTVTALSNVEMGALSKISVVRGAVGDFLGEGSSSETVSKGKFDGKSLVKSTLKASDVKSATCKLSDDGKYYIVTINVVTETNPKKSGSALGKFTKDFKDVDEIKAGLADVGASVESMTVTTTSVTINAKIRTDNNRFTSLNHTINMKANLKGVKYSIVRGVNASANMETKVSYTEFKY